MINCELSSTQCKTSEYSTLHQQCFKDKTIYFTCGLCNFQTQCGKVITTHYDDCLLVKTTEIQEKDLVIMNLRLSLQIEEMKNKLYYDIIQTHTVIINTKVQSCTVECNTEISIPDEEIVPDSPTTLITDDNSELSHTQIIDSIEKLLESIGTSDVYSTSLISIKNLRIKLLGTLTIKEYISLVEEHIQRVKDSFLSKKYTVKKINSSISRMLSPLDMRLICYDGYTNTSIDVDEIQKFGLALERLIEPTTQFVCYNEKVFLDNIKNYSLALFELSDCVKRSLISNSVFPTVIFVAREKSERKDPFSFYTLEKVQELRFWKLNCRLEDFSNDFSEHLLPYCIYLFRKLYKDVFNDNIYRVDYREKSIITQFDCEQLLLNIILLAQPMTLCKMFQEIIITNATFISTDSDKFNFYLDDKYQEKKFSFAKDNDVETSQIIKRIFDNISNDDAIHIITSR